MAVVVINGLWIVRVVEVVVVTTSFHPTYEPPNAAQYEKTKDGTNDS